MYTDTRIFFLVFSMQAIVSQIEQQDNTEQQYKDR